jgi:hypothetical protein
MEKPGKRPVILPRYQGRPYLRGVHHDIVKQAGLDPKEVRAWISPSKCGQRERDTGRAL